MNLPDHEAQVCRACRQPVESREGQWAHKDPLLPGRLRFWCPDKAGTLERIEPWPGLPSLEAEHGAGG